MEGMRCGDTPCSLLVLDLPLWTRAVGIYFAQLVICGAVNQSSDLEDGGHAGENLQEFREKPRD